MTTNGLDQNDDAGAGGTTRERTYGWNDPMPTAALASQLSGREFLERMVRGDIPSPPMAETLGFRLSEVGDGKVVVEGAPREWHFNPIGTVHAGLAATMLDTALACAVHSTLDVGTGYTTLEIKVNLTRAITASTGRLCALGEVVHRGRRVATAEARLVDDHGKVFAHGSTTCLLLDTSS